MNSVPDASEWTATAGNDTPSGCLAVSWFREPIHYAKRRYEVRCPCGTMETTVPVGLIEVEPRAQRDAFARLLREHRRAFRCHHWEDAERTWRAEYEELSRKRLYTERPSQRGEFLGLLLAACEADIDEARPEEEVQGQAS